MPEFNIPVYFTPGNFERALMRHGQHSRVYTSIPCICSKNTVNPDPNCNECLGRGVIFYPIKAIRRIEQYMSMGGNKIFTKGTIKSIRSVYTKKVNFFTVNMFQENIILLNENLKKGEFVYIDYEESLIEEYQGSGFYEGNRIWRIQIDGVKTQQGYFIGEILKINNVRNITKNKSEKVLAFWEDLILLEEEIEKDDILEFDCEYVKPIQMMVVNTDLISDKGKPGTVQTSRATLTFSGLYNFGKGDIFTLLKAESKESFIGEMPLNGNIYKSNYFHLSHIITIKDKIGFIEDAIIVRNSEIYFPTRRPEGRFSCSVMYNPTYIIEETPSMRYAEDKILPKKTTIRLYTRTSQNEIRPMPNNDYEREALY